MKRYKVIGYDKDLLAHRVWVLGELGPRWVDLQVYGSDTANLDPESMIGKTFEADYDHPYISLAMHPREVKEGA